MQNCCKPIAVRLRWLRQYISPWMMLTTSLIKILLFDGMEASRQQVCLMVALSRINFAEIYELMNDLLW